MGSPHIRSTQRTGASSPPFSRDGAGKRRSQTRPAPSPTLSRSPPGQWQIPRTDRAGSPCNGGSPSPPPGHLPGPIPIGHLASPAPPSNGRGHRRWRARTPSWRASRSPRRGRDAPSPGDGSAGPSGEGRGWKRVSRSRAGVLCTEQEYPTSVLLQQTDVRLYPI